MTKEKVCPRCYYKETDIIAIEREEKKKRYIYRCFFCDNEWEEETSFPKIDPERDKKTDSILLGFELFEVASACSLMMEPFLREGLSLSSSAKEKCLENLKYMQGLLGEIENEWGLPRVTEVVNSYEKDIEWGIKELEDFSRSSEGEVKKEAEKILKYFSSVKNVKISSF